MASSNGLAKVYFLFQVCNFFFKKNMSLQFFSFAIVFLAFVCYWFRKFLAKVLEIVDFQSVSKVLQACKMFAATYIAQNCGLSSQYVLIANNVLLELIQQLIDALSRYKFSSPLQICKVILHANICTNENGKQVIDQDFTTINMLLIDHMQKHSNVFFNTTKCKLDDKTVFFICSDVDLHLELQKHKFHISGKAKSSKLETSSEVMYVSEWQISSSTISNPSDIYKFINLERLKMIGKSRKQEDLNTIFVLSSNDNGWTNQVFTWLDNEAYEILSPQGCVSHLLERSKADKDFRHIMHSVGNVSFSKIYFGSEINVELISKNNRRGWQVTSKAPKKIIEDYLKSLMDKYHEKASREPFINFLKFQTKQEKENDTKKESENKESEFDFYSSGKWMECPSDGMKDLEQYFWTKSVESDVIEFLEKSRRNQEKRKKIGLGQSANFLLNGQPGTGKTALAVYFAHYLFSKHAEPVSVLTFDSNVFENKHTFDNAISQIYQNDNINDTIVVLIDEADKLPFFVNQTRESAQATKDDVDMSAFLEWLNKDKVPRTKSRYVFAMVNDPSILQKLNKNTNEALFRPGRFGKQIHVGGCDPHQFLQFCKFVFPEQNLQSEPTIYKRVVEVWEMYCNKPKSPFTIKIIEELVVEADFCWQTFLTLLDDIVAKIE